MGPRRIVCLTEEPTETLYLLGEQDRIVGISGFTVRPPRARREKPKVSAFISAKVDQILALKPDLAIGFSDMQADIARALVAAGVEVWISNHRSVAGILDYLRRQHEGILTTIRETLKFEDDTESSLADAYDSFLDQFETSEGGSIKAGNEAKEEALEDDELEQEQIVKQKRS